MMCGFLFVLKYVTFPWGLDPDPFSYGFYVSNAQAKHIHLSTENQREPCGLGGVRSWKVENCRRIKS